MNDFAGTIGRLTMARVRVVATDPATLKKAEKTQRREQMRVLRVAIETLATLEFGTLAAEARQSALDLQAAASDLKASLDRVQTAAQVINTVASAIKVVERFLALVA